MEVVLRPLLHSDIAFHSRPIRTWRSKHHEAMPAMSEAFRVRRWQLLHFVSAA